MDCLYILFSPKSFVSLWLMSRAILQYSGYSQSSCEARLAPVKRERLVVIYRWLPVHVTHG